MDLFLSVRRPDNGVVESGVAGHQNTVNAIRLRLKTSRAMCPTELPGENRTPGGRGEGARWNPCQLYAIELNSGNTLSQRRGRVGNKKKRKGGRGKGGRTVVGFYAYAWVRKLLIMSVFMEDAIIWAMFVRPPKEKIGALAVGGKCYPTARWLENIVL